MKELSIEEKAKRYDESIERAKEKQAAYKELFGDEYSGEDMVYIFPELAESEEEKLSKKLHECVCRAINNDKLPYEERKYISEKVIPYLENLEKQKEQKPQSKQEWREEDEDGVKTVLYILHEVADNYNFDEWLKGFKDRVQSQPKQEWSEEDEVAWNNTTIMIKECAANHYAQDSINLVVTWLKSLKDRVIPQTKQEWREEDEKIRNEIIDYLKGFIPHHDDDLVAKSRIWIAWLVKQGEKNN